MWLKNRILYGFKEKGCSSTDRRSKKPNVLNIAAGRQIFRTIIVKKGGAR